MDRNYMLVGIEANDTYHRILNDALPGDNFIIADEDSALEHLRNYAIDGVIIFVSRLSEPVKMVKELKKTKEYVPIILISPLPSTREMVEAIRAGALDYLPKSEQSDQLRRDLLKVSFIQE